MKEVPDCEIAKVVCVAGSVLPSTVQAQAPPGREQREEARGGVSERERGRRTARVRKMEREGARERKDSSELLS